MFIIIDGIDGSGKDTILDAWVAHLAAQGKKIFHLKEWWKEHHAHPEPEDLEGYDVLTSAEPTYVWFGAAIRQEFIRASARKYSAKAVAQAFSLDRLVLYKRVILPAQKRGMLILQSRGVSTTLVYQTAQGDPNVTPEYIMKLRGNAFALKHAPDVLFIADLDPAIAVERLAARSEKQDNAIFEKKELLEKLRANFRADWYRQIFESRGTKLVYFPTDENIDSMKEKAIQALLKIIT
ncbi:MAG: hypothetical protein AAB579_01075 [Patescibacteria group bacterium]